MEPGAGHGRGRVGGEEIEQLAVHRVEPGLLLEQSEDREGTRHAAADLQRTHAVRSVSAEDAPVPPWAEADRGHLHQGRAVAFHLEDGQLLGPNEVDLQALPLARLRI